MTTTVQDLRGLAEKYYKALGSSEDFSEEIADVFSGLLEQPLILGREGRQVVLACRVYVIARDVGLEAAMMWKLTNS